MCAVVLGAAVGSFLTSAIGRARAGRAAVAAAADGGGVAAAGGGQAVRGSSWRAGLFGYV